MTVRVLTCLLLIAAATGCSTLDSIDHSTRKRDTQALLEHLSDERSFVRELAARGLGETGDSRAVPALIGCLEAAGEHHYVKSAAVESLGRIGNEKAVPAIIDLLASSSHEEIRFLCVQVLYLFRNKDPEVVGAIESVARDESLLVRSLAEAVLHNIREER